MDETAYPVEQRHRGLYLFGFLFYGVIAAFTIVLMAAEDLFGFLFPSLFFSMLAVSSLVGYIGVRRGRLILGRQKIAWYGLKDKILATQLVSKIVWADSGRAFVTFKSPRGNMKVNLEKFEVRDRIRLVEDICNRFVVPQENWPQFCHTHAIKWLDNERKKARGKRPVREPESDEFLKTRRRLGWELLAVTSLVSVIWVAVFGEELGWGEFLSTVDLTQFLLMWTALVFPVMLLVAFSVFLFLRFPKEGQLQTRVLKTDKERREFNLVLKYAIPVLLVFGGWIFGGHFVFATLLGLDGDIHWLATILLALLLWIGGTIIYMLATSASPADPDIQASVERWRKHFSLGRMVFDDRGYNERHFLA